MNLAPELLLNLVVYLAIAAAAIIGLVVLQRRRERRLPLPRLRPGSWSGGEVLLCFILSQLVPAILMLVLDEAGAFFTIFDKHVSGLRQFILLSPLTLALLFAIYFTMLHRISNTRPAHVGLSCVRWRPNVRLGLLAYCVVTPLVLGLYLLAQTMTPHVAHPYESFGAEDTRPFEWILLACAAVVLPALSEEWLFRGLLQGWLRRATPLGHFVIAGVALFEGCRPFIKSILDRLDHAAVVQVLQVGAPAALAGMAPAPPSILWESLVFALLVVGGYIVGVLRLWRPVFHAGLRHFVEQSAQVEVGMTTRLDQLEGQTPLLLPSGPRWEEFKRANARWAVVGSAVLFALMHEAWPAAVALLPLGLVLGWLAYRTQSLIPGIVLHALFNTVAYLVLMFSKPV